MEFSKKTWSNGQVVKAEDINRWETGIADIAEQSTETVKEVNGVKPTNGKVTILIPEIATGAITPEKLSFIPVTAQLGKNLFNKEKIETGLIHELQGHILTGADFDPFFTTEFILIQPSTNYVMSGSTNMFRRVVFFDGEKKLISALKTTDSFTSPTNAVFMRLSAHKNNDLAYFQVEKGSNATSYETYGVKLDPKFLPATSATLPKPIYRFRDAWVAWLKGEKFPVAFYGDSTIDGLGTTGFSGNGLGRDSSSPNTFSKKLEEHLRGATGNTTMRIYNAGFSGTDSAYGIQNISAEFAGSAVYNDVKMVGIGFGINDRLKYPNMQAYRIGFRNNIVTMIDWFYKNNIQPFLLTTQASINPGVSTEQQAFPMRTSEAIENVTNEVKRELAKEYDLEMVDMNKFTEDFLHYSSYPVKTIISDRLHFGDIGHKFEADVLYSHLSPRVVKVDGFAKIDYSNQTLDLGIPEDKVTMPTDITGDRFKLYANYTKSDSNDTKIMQVHVFNMSKKPLTLKAYKNSSDSLTYVKMNGTTKTLDSLEKSLGTLEMGLYKLEVFTGASTKADFKGFIVE